MSEIDPSVGLHATIGVPEICHSFGFVNGVYCPQNLAMKHGPRCYARRLIMSLSEEWEVGMNDDERWMGEAIKLAKTKGTQPSDTPIAAIIVRDGAVLAAETNRTAEDNDATAHAEICAYRAAGAKAGDMELRGATLYSTLQPCGMCTMASIWAKVDRIVYGAGREDVHRMYFEDRNLDTIDFIQDAYRDDLTIEGGCLAKECAELYYAPQDEVPMEEQGNV